MNVPYGKDVMRRSVVRDRVAGVGQGALLSSAGREDLETFREGRREQGTEDTVRAKAPRQERA